MQPQAAQRRMVQGCARHRNPLSATKTPKDSTNRGKCKPLPRSRLTVHGAPHSRPSRAIHNPPNSHRTDEPRPRWASASRADTRRDGCKSRSSTGGEITLGPLTTKPAQAGKKTGRAMLLRLQSRRSVHGAEAAGTNTHDAGRASADAAAAGAPPSEQAHHNNSNRAVANP